MTRIDLPDSPPNLDVALSSVLQKRASIRTFSSKPLVLTELASLLWAGQGTTHATTGKQLRTAPSSGAHHPFTLHVFALEDACISLSGGIYQYDPMGHSLLHTSQIQDEHDLAIACMGQQAITESTLVIGLAADYTAVEDEYPEKGKQFVLMEAGHIAQNILLMATALQIGACPVGLFDDEEVAQIFTIPENQHMVYLIPIGTPDE